MTEHAPRRLYLREDQIPKQWYNLRADMTEKPEPDPLLPTRPRTSRDRRTCYPVFCEKLAHQELDDETALRRYP